jgi:Flp pilus assembly protein TadD
MKERPAGQRRVAALKPDHLEAYCYYRVGVALERAGHLAGALAAFNQALDVPPIPAAEQLTLALV